MDHVPPEVTNMIFEAVASPNDRASRKDLCNLRMVNKSFSVMGAPHVFHTIPLWIGLRSLENLHTLSQHPTISKLVTHIKFSVVQIKADKEGNMHQEVKAKFEADHGNHAISTCDIAVIKHMAARANYIEAQKWLHTSKQALMLLTRAFSKFSSLQSFSVSIGDDWIGAKELNQAFGRLIGDEILFSTKSILPIAFRALHTARVKLEELSISVRAGSPSRPYGSLNPCGITPSRRHLMRRMTDDCMTAALAAFPMDFTADHCWKSLKSLGLMLPAFGGQRHYKTCERIFNQLHACKDLSALTVTGLSALWQDAYFGSGTQQFLPNLLYLDLKLVEFPHFKGFLGFFYAHCDKLQTVKFLWVKFADPGVADPWKTAAARMRRWTWSAIQSFTISESFGETPDGDIAPYLRKEVMDNPCAA
ncbi:uncharacterized protein KY384_004718 [Bacidia gigantensis]|uniref:uncharacterized protein n=1 Tax=Bacidia gigantensis TaxID=2732470 RepID=UPI001D03A2B1|nr:uncharacterized protein KY384_004718 [Bacidia gigantensis]KAG8530218.1 hypothetical protein KY384_004718 [Bacidia gigantensis]